MLRENNGSVTPLEDFLSTFLYFSAAAPQTPDDLQWLLNETKEAWEISLDAAHKMVTDHPSFVLAGNPPA